MTLNNIHQIQQAIINRLYKNGFIPRTFLSFNPHQTNCSHTYLAYHLRNCLKKYYSQPSVLGKRFNNHVDEQYKLVIFIENGNLRDFEKHPHLHILTELEGSKAELFYNFLLSNLENHYPFITADLQNITDTPQDLLNVWSYCDKEQREFERGQSKYGNVILTHRDLQKKLASNKPADIYNWFSDCQS